MQETLLVLIISILGTLLGGWLLHWLTGLPFSRALVLLVFFTLAGCAALYVLSPSPAKQEPPVPSRPVGEFVPSPSPPPQRVALEGLVGKSKTAPEVVRFLKTMDGNSKGCPGEEHCRAYEDNGLDVVFDGEGDLEKFVVYADGDPKHSRYQGGLPQGISLDLTRDEVHALLGEDPENHRGDSLWCEYRLRGYRLGLDYFEDGNIRKIAVLQVEKFGGGATSASR